MLSRLISFFAHRHLLINFLFVAVLAGGVYFWQHTNKEEMPNISLNFVRIRATYSGATPSEVEFYVTKPIEDAIRGLDGIHNVRSTSTTGNCTIFIEIDPDADDLDNITNEIQSAVSTVNLPDDIRDDPRVRQFKTSKKAIVDIGLYNDQVHLLDHSRRRELQRYVLSLQNQLESMSCVAEVGRSGFLSEEVHINLRPQRLRDYNISIAAVKNKIKSHNIRQPAGSLEDEDESKLTVFSPLYSIDELKRLIIRGGFSGGAVRLGQIADIQRGFEKNTSISKVNGHEAVVLKVTKTANAGILDAMDRIKKKIRVFDGTALSSSPVRVVALDDESLSVRNRLNIIALNGTIGFTLILIILFIFMDFTSGVWVAMGIPFTFCFTMIIASMMGHTINNITLAAVIIVMGMIVDDAIVVAENVSRLRSEGAPLSEAVVKGTAYMFLPIVASITTTCVAFVPILAMEGRFSRMNNAIPVIVILMLAGSLLESLLILPGHLNHRFSRRWRVIFSLGLLPLIEKRFAKHRPPAAEEPPPKRHWFHHAETLYGKILTRLLHFKTITFLLLAGVTVAAVYIFSAHMKFVMFPSEETSELRFMARAPAHTPREKTVRYSRDIDAIIRPYIGKDVVGYRSHVGQGRRGGKSQENEMMMRVELVPREKRRKGLPRLMKEWREAFAKLDRFEEVRIFKRRFGHASGSPIEIKVLSSDDKVRRQAADALFEVMAADKTLKNAEVDRPLMNSEYRLSLKRDLVERTAVNASAIPDALRTILDGSILYEIPAGDETINLKLTVRTNWKEDLRTVLNLPVENRADYLVPLGELVRLRKTKTPSSIPREKYKRPPAISPDTPAPTEKKNRPEKIAKRRKEKKPAGKSGGSPKKRPGQRKNRSQGEAATGKPVKTPLEIAEHYETEVFPRILSRFPSVTLFFDGEVKDTRESTGEFKAAVLMTVFLIYIILALLFNSLFKPLIIMLSIPIGVVGVILAFYLHGITLYGFFALIGILGLSGVIVNDSIIMLVKLEDNIGLTGGVKPTAAAIAETSQTRLRAVLLTTLTTAAGLFPTAYGVAGYDSMLAEMMLAMGWGIIFGTAITLVVIPSVYSLLIDIRYRFFPPEARHV